MNPTFKNLLETKMSRREFLARMGAFAMVLTGISGIIKALTMESSQLKGSGYGDSTYGGAQKPAASRKVHL